MTVLSNVLAKAKEVLEAVKADVAKSDLVAKVQSFVSTLETEVKKEVKSGVAKGETEVKTALDQPKAGETPEGSTTGPQPSDPATDNVNMAGSDQPTTGTPIVTPPADVNTTADVAAPATPDGGQTANPASGVGNSSDLQ